jgi:hypothetical protein
MLLWRRRLLQRGQVFVDERQSAREQRMPGDVPATVTEMAGGARRVTRPENLSRIIGRFTH